MPSPELPEAIEEAKRLHAAATPGEWLAQILRTGRHATISIKCREDCDVVGWTGFDDSHRDVETHVANACSIATAHNLLPKLIAAYEAALADLALERESCNRQALLLARVQAAAAKHDHPGCNTGAHALAAEVRNLLRGE